MSIRDHGYLRRSRAGKYRDRFGVEHACHSLMEVRRLKVLEGAGLRFRREAVVIPYLFEGRRRSYRIDILVMDKHGRWLRFEEVKPRALWDLPQNRAKWAAARAWCASRYQPPIEFRVVDEVGVQTP